ncbi:MAG TPA: pilus assembly protein PilB, partial [Verrucomicrobiales bacterium]|nr:pilus assembly protein PilB [Verrucomicrobiales bacterium]
MIDDSQREDYIAAAYGSDHDITYAVEEMGLLQREQLFQLVAQDIGGEYYDLTDFEPAPQMLLAVPAGTAKLYQCFPIQFLEHGLQVAIANPLDPQNLEELGFSLNQNIIPAVAPPEQIQALIEKYYYGGSAKGAANQGPAGESDALAAIRAEVAALSNDDLEAESNSAPIIRYVDLVLYQAIKEKASDVHFEPFEDDFKIRYRVDGALYEM